MTIVCIGLGPVGCHASYVLDVCACVLAGEEEGGKGATRQTTYVCGGGGGTETCSMS